MKSSESSGQPSVEWGHSPELNQVSSTSLSCRRFCDRQLPHSSGSSTAAVWWPQSSQYHTGMRCPHHSWRLMHQSRMFSSQLRYTRVKRSGTSLIRPSTTAAWALPAMESGCSWDPTLTNHCWVNSGSTTELHRWQRPTECWYSSVFSNNPKLSNSAATSSRAWNRSLPAYFPAASVKLPSKPTTVTISSW